MTAYDLEAVIGLVLVIGGGLLYVFLLYWFVMRKQNLKFIDAAKALSTMSIWLIVGVIALIVGGLAAFCFGSLLIWAAPVLIPLAAFLIIVKLLG